MANSNNSNSSGATSINTSGSISSNGAYYTFQTVFPWGMPTLPIKLPENLTAAPKDDRDGLDCSKCKEFAPLAAANQENGTFICWACRNNYNI